MLCFAGTPSVYAQSCDCTQIVSSCTGSVAMTPTGSQKGLYGADLTISANAQQCAKVEYFVDNTPAFTILVNGRSGTDRVMGTSETPMTADRVTYQSCRVCKAGASNAAEKSAAQTRNEAEMLFDAALDRNDFNPYSKDEAFQRLAGNAGAVDGANMAAMMSVMQSMQQLQATVGRSASVPAAVAVSPSAAPAKKTTDTCTSKGFRTCDFGWPEDVPRK
jgi:hypothetical protein